MSRPTPTKIVTYGTSLTAGGAWVTQIQTWLNDQFPGQCTLLNSGMGSMASNTGVKLLTPKVLDHKPDVLLIEFAVNDAYRAYDPNQPDFDISLEKSRDNLHAIIDQTLAISPHCKVFIQTMNPAWDAPNGWGCETKRPDLDAYYQGYRDVASQRGLPLIDHHPVWRAIQQHHRTLFERYIDDGVHPIAEACEHVVTPAIKAALLAEKIVG